MKTEELFWSMLVSARVQAERVNTNGRSMISVKGSQFIFKDGVFKGAKELNREGKP